MLMDALTALSQPVALLRPLRRPLKLYGPLWVVWPRPVKVQVQRVPERGIGAFPMGGRDVEGLAAGQLHAGRHEMKLCPPALGVGMADPSDVVLLPIEASEGQTLKGVHGELLLLLGGPVLGRKGQDAMGVAPLAFDAVDQVAGAVHVTPHHLGRRMASAFLAGQILRDRPPATAPAARELNQHRRASHGQRGSLQARGQFRSGGSTAARLPAAACGSRRGQAGSDCSRSAQAHAATRGQPWAVRGASAGANPKA